MSNNKLPAIRPDTQIARKDDKNDSAAEVTEIEGNITWHPPLSSAAGQLIKAVAYTALEWLSNRRISERSPINRGSKEIAPTRWNNRRLSSIRMVGGRRYQQFPQEDEDRFPRAGGRRSQRCRSGGNRIRRRKKWFR